MYGGMGQRGDGGHGLLDLVRSPRPDPGQTDIHLLDVEVVGWLS